MTHGTAPPRLLNRAALRAYLGGISAIELNERMTAKLLPGPLWGASPDDRNARWDVRAVDRALDAAGGPVATLAAAEDFLDRALGFR